MALAAATSTAQPTIPPVMVRIAACESTGNPNGTPRQFNSDGSILWGNDSKTGKVIKRDEGQYQINSWVWQKKADELGYDISTEQGNIGFALYLYSKYGTSPWEASSACWSK